MARISILPASKGPRSVAVVSVSPSPIIPMSSFERPTSLLPSPAQDHMIHSKAKQKWCLNYLPPQISFSSADNGSCL